MQGKPGTTTKATFPDSRNALAAAAESTTRALTSGDAIWESRRSAPGPDSIATFDGSGGRLRNATPTGVGKWPVEQVVITHGHSDHCALLPKIREAFHPRVLAYSPNTSGVDRLLRDGDAIKMGDQYFEVIHTPGHSSDSICLYNGTEGVLFAGDTPLLLGSPDSTYETGFLTALAKLCARDIRRDLFRARAAADGELQREAAGIAADGRGRRASDFASVFDNFQECEEE